MGFITTDEYSRKVVASTLEYYDKRTRECLYEMVHSAREGFGNEYRDARNAHDAVKSFSFLFHRVTNNHMGGDDPSIAMLFVDPADVEVIDNLEVAKYISWSIRSGDVYEPIVDWIGHMSGALVNHASVETPDWSSHS